MTDSGLPEIPATQTVDTDRLEIAYRESGSPGAPTLLLIHGNVSSNLFWDTTMPAFADDFHVVAPDLRGYGETEPRPIDATRGVRDWSDDIRALMEALDLAPAHVLGWSLGGGVAMQLAVDAPEVFRSLILLNPVSPYGFGGTKDVEGTPTWESFAGSGGGTANPAFVEALAQGDRSGEGDQSPRTVMRQFYFRPQFELSAEREDRYVRSMLSTRVGDGFYPGDAVETDDWPGVAPGTGGNNNALSPKYLDLSALAETEPQPPVLWLRGAEDGIVSDYSFFDFGTLGQEGLVPGWPGEEVVPPQPMVSQTRHVLEQYSDNGGTYQEQVIDRAAHSPHIEQPAAFREMLRSFLAGINDE